MFFSFTESYKKWVHYNNLKCWKSWVNPKQAATANSGENVFGDMWKACCIMAWWRLVKLTAKCKSTPSKFDCCNIEKKNCHLQNERAYQIIICFDQYNITHLVQNLKMFLMLKVSLSTLTFLSRWNLKTYRKLAYSHRKSRKIISWLIDICACYY